MPETAAHLDAAIVEAHRRDAEIEKLRKTAQYAGEQDPYREPGERGTRAGDDEDTTE